MHRDVKPGNIMLHKMLVLVDFGLCRRFRSAEICTEESVRSMTGIVGTFRFMAPEVFRKEHYDAKIDVYSGSMVVYVMLFGKLPFVNMSGEAVAKLVARVSLQPDFSSCKNKVFARLLMQACDMDPNLRPHAHEMDVEIKSLHDDLISSKVTSGFLSAFDKFRRVSSAFSHTSSTFSRTSSTSTSTRTVESSTAQHLTRSSSAFSRTSSTRAVESRTSSTWTRIETPPTVEVGLQRPDSSFEPFSMDVLDALSQDPSAMTNNRAASIHGEGVGDKQLQASSSCDDQDVPSAFDSFRCFDSFRRVSSA